MSSYTKMSLVITTEIFILVFMNVIIKSFNQAFDSWYIIPALISLLLTQMIGLFLSSIDSFKEIKELEKELQNLERKE